MKARVKINMCFHVEHVTRLIPLAPILNPNNTEIIGIRPELCPAVQDISLTQNRRLFSSLGCTKCHKK